jgi:nucleotide-binding universal stress UspA family protein
MAEMAEFTMSLIAEQARKQGVAKTDYIVREGEVRQELLALVVEVDADVLVMGRPKAGPGQRAFGSSERDELISELEQRGVIVDT